MWLVFQSQRSAPKPVALEVGLFSVALPVSTDYRGELTLTYFKRTIPQCRRLLNIWKSGSSSPRHRD
jgi:hypothetical protein